MKSRSRGFTLMELMVVLVLAGIILALGAPGFNQFRLNSRMTNTANDVLAGIVKARNEAIKSQRDVSICASLAPLAANPICTDGATQGFIVFRDTSRDCLRQAGEDAVYAHEYEVTFATTDPLNVRSNGDCLSFAPTGFRQNIAGRVTVTRMVFCDNRGTAVVAGTTSSAARGISISQTGRARVTRITAGSGPANGEGFADDISTWADTTCP